MHRNDLVFPDHEFPSMNIASLTLGPVQRYPALYNGRRRRAPGLTFFRRVRAWADREVTKALCGRGLRLEFVEHGIRTRFGRCRSLPFAISPEGAVPSGRGRRKDVHEVRSAPDLLAAEVLLIENDMNSNHLNLFYL